MYQYVMKVHKIIVMGDRETMISWTGVWMTAILEMPDLQLPEYLRHKNKRKKFSICHSIVVTETINHNQIL